MAATILSACATEPKSPVPVIVADGTEAQQFAKLITCGNVEKFVTEVGKVGKHLGSTWDEVLGKDNTQKCSIRIRVDQHGQIQGREVLACDDVAALDKVLAAASPVPVPQDPCLLSHVNGIAIQLNGTTAGQ